MLESKVELLIVRGAPGAGKSTAVRLLRKMIPGGAIIEVDALRAMIAAVQWVNTEQHWIALDHARLLSQSFAAKGLRPVVLVDTFSRGKLTAFVATLDLTYRVASLFLDEAELINRVNGRPEGGFKDIEACRVLNAEVASNRYEHERLIDVTNLQPSAVAEALLDVLCSP